MASHLLLQSAKKLQLLEKLCKLFFNRQMACKAANESALTQLAKVTCLACDTGDIEELKKYKVMDATTNPNIVLAASSKECNLPFLCEAIEYGTCEKGSLEKKASETLDYLTVLFGSEILKVIPGRVSTEVDARLSFDTKGSVEKALKLIKLYSDFNVDKDRVLIKLASTWEGIQAAMILEKEHSVHCNLTLLFSMVQAVACAEAGVTLISPFVGRIMDWYVANTECKKFEPQYDPGVVSATNIYNYYKKFDYKTQVMGASFRNTGQIKALAGCDLLTISPALMEELSKDQDEVKACLSAEKAKTADLQKMCVDENQFRYQLNEDKMASDKLAEGIRNFAADTVRLEQLIQKHLCY